MKKQFNKAKIIADKLKNSGASSCLLIGGCVRDHLLNVDSKDIDLEVYGLSYNQIVEALSNDFRVDMVGKSFGVLKVGHEIDVSIPRRESKKGIGHKGFEIEVDPTMTVAEAIRRRDFTINSIAMDFEGNIIDPLNGRIDLQKKILKACSEAYVEDPLRVLRGMQFAGRFGLKMDSDTIAMSKKILPEYDTLAKERIFEEWKKWAVKSKFPKMGLDILLKTSWIEKYPILVTMKKTPQDPVWHPEGDVLTHTGHVCDAGSEIAERERLSETDRLILIFAGLCHDLGKAVTTEKNDLGRWVCPGHAEVGVDLTKKFMTQIHAPKNLIESVIPLVKEHMAHVSHPPEADPSDRTIRRLANRLSPTTMKLWAMVCESDASGRPPLPKKNPVENWIAVANELKLKDGKPKPLLMGRHLIELGVKPGKEMGKILAEAFENQLDGKIGSLEEAIEWLKSSGIVKKQT